MKSLKLNPFTNTSKKINRKSNLQKQRAIFQRSDI